MAAEYLVGYDLHRPGQDYAGLKEAIKLISLGGWQWWHFLDSTWIVRTDLSAAEVRDALAPHIDRNDRLVVLRLSGEWASQNLPKRGSDWLREHVSGQAALRQLTALLSDLGE